MNSDKYKHINRNKYSALKHELGNYLIQDKQGKASFLALNFPEHNTFLREDPRRSPRPDYYKALFDSPHISFLT